MGLEWISEVQVVRHGGRKCANTHEVPGRFGHGGQRSRPGVQVDITAVAVGGCGYRPARAAKAHDTGIAPRSHRSAGPYGGVVLAIDPLFGGYVGRPHQLQERLGLIGVCLVEAREIRTSQLPDFFGLDTLPLVRRAALRQGQGGDLRDHSVPLEDAEQSVIGNAPDLLGLEFPLGQDVAHHIFAPTLRDDQHTLLGFRQEDLVGSHPGFPDGHELHVDLHAVARTARHL